MARNIGESLNEQNIVLETKEDKYRGNQNPDITENSNTLSQKNHSSINPNKVDSAPQPQIEMDTLSESVTETLMRDLTKIGHKIEYVLIPRFNADKSKQLRNCNVFSYLGDLWGPLLLCILLSITLSLSSKEKGNIFVTIFVIVWVGGAILTVNSQALGAKISIFQSICLLGYCLFPIVLAAVVIKICSFLPIYIKFIIVMVAFLWSYLSSIGFMSQLIENEKKFLATYPILLFYLFLACFVISAK